MKVVLSGTKGRIGNKVSDTENTVICNDCNETRRPKFCVTNIHTQNLIYVFPVTRILRSLNYMAY